MCRQLAAILLLATAAPALAAGSVAASPFDLCRHERPLVHELWQKRLFQASAIAFDVVNAAIDGDATKARQALRTLPPSEATRWRQVAMYTAAEQGQTAVVDTLLDDGAKANGSALIPALDSRLYAGTAELLEQKMGAKAIDALHSAGAMNNDPRPSGPPLFATINCNDLPTTEALLKHGADPMWRNPEYPNSAIDPFTMAVVEGRGDIVMVFLDNGANPCLEDRRHVHPKLHRPPSTLASIGANAGLPATLVRRLTCQAHLTTH